MPLYELGKWKVYFAFPDGLWSYDCIECGSKCCKGHEFGGTGSEFVGLVSKYPQLQLFSSLRYNMVNFANFQGGCFFLEESGLCKVQNEHGYDAKAFTCKTFPFNNYNIVGNTLIVSFHTLCSIRLAGSYKNNDNTVARYTITHQGLLKEIEENLESIEISTSSQPLAGGMQSQNKASESESFFEKEMAIQNLIKDNTNADDFTLWAMIESFQNESDLKTQNLEPKVAEFKNIHHAIHAFFGVADQPSDTKSIPALRSMIPYIRLQMLTKMTFLEPEDILDLFGATMVGLHYFTQQASSLAQRELTLEENISLAEKMFWPAFLIQFLDSIPWLDLDENTNRQPEVPRRYPEIVQFMEIMLEDEGTKDLKSMMREAGLSTPIMQLNCLHYLGQITPWLRFSTVQNQQLAS